MSLKSRLTSLIFAPLSHHEPLSRLDILDGLVEPQEDFAGESRVEVTTPKQVAR